MIIFAINRFVIIVNFRNHFDKVLTEIFHFRRALMYSENGNYILCYLLKDGFNVKQSVKGLQWKGGLLSYKMRWKMPTNV